MKDRFKKLKTISLLLVVATLTGCFDDNSTTVNTHANLPLPTISKSMTIKDLQIDLAECKRTGPRIVCSFIVTNIGKDNNYTFSNYNEQSVAYDEFGIKHTPSSIKLVNQSHQYQVNHRLINNVPVSVSSTFDNVPEKVTQFTVINVTVGAKAEFRAIAIKL